LERRQAEDRAAGVFGAAAVFRGNRDSPIFGRPVEDATGALDQSVWASAVRVVEAVQRRQRAAGGELEDRAIAVGPSEAVVP
jgi:hypothetical protein